MKKATQLSQKLGWSMMEDNMQIRVLKMYALNDNVADTSLF